MFKTVRTDSIDYTTNEPDVVVTREDIPLADNLKRIQLTVAVTCVVTTTGH